VLAVVVPGGVSRREGGERFIVTGLDDLVDLTLIGASLLVVEVVNLFFDVFPRYCSPFMLPL